MNSSLFKLNDDRKTKKWKTHLAKTPPSPNQVDKFLIIHFFLLEKALSIQREVMFTTLDWFEATNEKTIIVACPAPLYNRQLSRALSS